jgi:pilus assembly protein Flp/PilA
MMTAHLIKLIRSARGATAVEYGLIVAIIVIGLLAGLSVLGSSSGVMWGNINSKVGNALPVS